MVGPSAPAAAAPDELRGTSILITGAGRRGQAGEVVAGAFARAGARLVLVDRETDVVNERASDLSTQGATVHPFACDLTDAAAVGVLSDNVSRLAPDGLSAVVHMAGGYVEGAPVADTEPKTWHKLIAINLTTAFVATHAFLPLVRRAKGAMVYFASTAALPGAAVSSMAAYAAAKGGVVTLMRAVAAEEKGNGVRANALAPQAIRTDQNLESMGKDRQYVERETVAAWVIWLCSRAAGPISGQVIRLG
jgi:NAD(P)-dependent dehydrogenase (short-subunit alcohol dehydrogenase family)